MWDKYRIVINAIVRDEYQGLRVTPNVYTRPQDIDTFTNAMEEIADTGGIPTQ
jgi:selenocysteine lyase/cysteine desulfurase